MEFDKVIELNVQSKNNLKIGYKGESKFFIKEYVLREGREEEDLINAECEMMSYEKLRGFLLPRLVEFDLKVKRMILEFVEYRDFKLSKRGIDEIIDYYSNKILKASASFLPEVKFDYFEGSLFRRIRLLSEMRIVNESKIIDLFLENKKMINNSLKTFSHGDFHLGNLQYLGDDLTIVDLEHSRRDSPMYDLATVYIGLYHRRNLLKYFYSRIKNMKVFDKKMFDLMLLRRCVETLNAFKDNREFAPYVSAKKILDGLILDF